MTLGRGLQDVARQVQIGAGGAHDGRGHGVSLGAMRRWETTAPAFCESPVWSSPPTAKPAYFGGAAP